MVILIKTQSIPTKRKGRLASGTSLDSYENKCSEDRRGFDPTVRN